MDDERGRTYGPAGTVRRRRRVWPTLLLSFGVLLLLAATGGFVSLHYVTAKINASLKDTTLLNNQVRAGNSISGPINILLAGLDTRPGNTIGSHSDSIIIMHIPASHDQVYMISIPRDTDAYVPADAATHWPGGHSKITSAFAFGSQDHGGLEGGMSLLAATIKQNYGISFNGAAVIDFSGFSDLVTKLGGVTMTVDEKTTSIHHGYLIADPSKHAKPYVLDKNCGCPKYGFDHPITGTKPVVYNVGKQHLSAYEALDYVRIRDGLPYADYDRQRHQQQFLKALIGEMYSKGITSPTKLPGFLDSLGKAIVFDRGGVSLTDWMFTLKGLTPNSLVTIKTNDGVYVHYTGPADDSRQALNAASRQLLADVISDKVGTFVQQHPNWVATSST